MSYFSKPEIFLRLTLLFDSVILFKPTLLYYSLKQADQTLVDSDLGERHSPKSQTSQGANRYPMK